MRRVDAFASFDELPSLMSWRRVVSFRRYYLAVEVLFYQWGHSNFPSYFTAEAHFPSSASQGRRSIYGASGAASLSITRSYYLPSIFACP